MALIAVVACSVAFTALRTKARGSGEERVINWLNNFEQAQKIARETGKPLCVVFR
jgi:hypothetical protein